MIKDLDKKMKLTDEQLNAVSGGTADTATIALALVSIDFSSLPAAKRTELSDMIYSWYKDPDREYTFEEINQVLKDNGLGEITKTC